MRFASRVIIILVGSLLFMGQSQDSQAATTSPDLFPAEAANRAPVRVFWHSALPDTPPFLGSAAVSQAVLLAATPDGAAGIEAAGRTFLRAYYRELGLDAPAIWRLQRREQEAAGQTHLFFQQMAGEFPVFAGEVAVHFDETGRVTAVNGRYLAETAAHPLPTLTPDQALAAFQNELALHTQSDWPELVRETDQLVVYNPALVGNGRSRNHLAYHLTISDKATPHAWTALIDAQTGQTLLYYDILETVLNRAIHELGGSTTLPGTPCYNESGPIGSPSTDCTAAYNYSGETYNYFFDEHGRDSYNNSGATLTASVNYGTTANAFWNGSQTAYGPGYATRDVVAHEWTHAVTQYTAGLIYAYQPGALNESISDIFGAMVDDDDWDMGEDLPIGAIRSLADPTLHGDPGKVSDAQYYCGGGDNGGVHINSGVPNHAAYLMAEGGSYNGQTMTALGRSQTAAIFYRALTTYLTSGSDFADTGDALISAATDLHGAGSTAVTTTTTAVEAVELHLPACLVLPDSYEADNTAGLASTIAVNGAAQSHNFHRRDASWLADNDWVKFSATAGQTYDIRTQNVGSGVNTMLFIYDSDGTTLLALDEDDVGVNNSQIIFEAPVTAVYAIYVRELYGSTGEYELSVTTTNATPTTSCATGDGFESDNTPATATPIVADGATQNHNLFCLLDEDWAALTAVSGQTYTIQATGFTSAVLELYDTDGTTLLAYHHDNGVSPHQIEWQAPANGTYYLRVRHYWGLFGTFGSGTAYTLGVTSGGTPDPTCATADAFESDNAAADASTFAVNGANQLHNGYCPGDVDWVKFTAVSGQTYAIESLNAGQGYPYVTLRLFDTNATTLLAADYNSKGGGLSRILWQAPTNGTYYVQVTPIYYGNSTDYLLSITTTNLSPVPSCVTNADSYEADDNFGDASTIATDGTIQSHTIHCPYDADWVQFSATAGTPYLLQTLNATNTDMRFDLYHSDGQTRFPLSSGDSFPNDAYMMWTPSTSGTYYVRLAHSSFAYGSYRTYQFQIVVPCTNPDGYETDNQTGQATTLVAGAAAQAHNFDCPGDVDWFEFTAVSGNTYTFTTSNLGSSSDTALYLYDTDGTTPLTYDQNGGGGRASLLEWTAPANGTYYLMAKNEVDTAGTTTAYDIALTETVPCQPPNPVTGLEITYASGTSTVHLTWDDLGVPSYEVWYTLDAPYFMPGADCSNPGAGLNCQLVNGVTGYSHVINSSNNYYYLVLGINACGESSPATSTRLSRFRYSLVPGS